MSRTLYKPLDAAILGGVIPPDQPRSPVAPPEPDDPVQYREAARDAIGRAVYGAPVITPESEDRQLTIARYHQVRAMQGQGPMEGRETPARAFADMRLMQRAQEVIDADGASDEERQWAAGYLADVDQRRTTAINQTERNRANMLAPADYAARVAELQGQGYSDPAIARLMRDGGWRAQRALGETAAIEEQIEIMRDAGDYERAGRLSRALTYMRSQGDGVDPNAALKDQDRLAADVAEHLYETSTGAEKTSMILANGFMGGARAIRRLAGSYPQEADILERFAESLEQSHPVAGRAANIGAGFSDPVFLAADVITSMIGLGPVTRAARARYAVQMAERGFTKELAGRAAEKLTAEGLARNRLANVARTFAAKAGVKLSDEAAEGVGRTLWHTIPGAIGGATAGGLYAASEGASPIDVAKAALLNAGFGAGFGLILGKAFDAGGAVIRAAKLDLPKPVRESLAKAVDDARAAGLGDEEAEAYRRELSRGVRALRGAQSAAGPLTDAEIGQVLADSGVDLRRYSPERIASEKQEADEWMKAAAESLDDEGQPAAPSPAEELAPEAQTGAAGAPADRLTGTDQTRLGRSERATADDLVEYVRTMEGESADLLKPMLDAEKEGFVRVRVPKEDVDANIMLDAEGVPLQGQFDPVKLENANDFPAETSPPIVTIRGEDGRVKVIDGTHRTFRAQTDPDVTTIDAWVPESWAKERGLLSEAGKESSPEAPAAAVKPEAQADESVKGPIGEPEPADAARTAADNAPAVKSWLFDSSLDLKDMGAQAVVEQLPDGRFRVKIYDKDVQFSGSKAQGVVGGLGEQPIMVGFSTANNHFKALDEVVGPLERSPEGLREYARRKGLVGEEFENRPSRKPELQKEAEEYAKKAAPKIGSAKTGESLRKAAESRRGQAAKKLESTYAQSPNTARQARIGDSIRKDAERLERQAVIMDKLADLHERGEVPPLLEKVTSPGMIDHILLHVEPVSSAFVQKADVKEALERLAGKPGVADLREGLRYITTFGDSNYGRVAVSDLEEMESTWKMIQELQKRSGVKISTDDFPIQIALRKAGLTTKEQGKEARELLRNLAEVRLTPEQMQAREIERLMSELRQNPKAGNDYFPTPERVGRMMMDLAEVESGMKVLEPSAGHGALADLAKEAGAEVDTAEVSQQLRRILEAKGYPNVGHDFLESTPAPVYDRVIMNPPFGKDGGIEHVEHALKYVKPGGRLVAVMSESVFTGESAKYKAFRARLDDLEADVHDVEAGAFNERGLVNRTGVKTRIVVIDKPAEGGAAAPAPAPPRPAGKKKPAKADEADVRYASDVLPPERLTLPHFTTPESAAALRSGEMFRVDRPAQHGLTKGLGEEASPERFAGPALYLSLDDERWSRVPVVDEGVKPEALKPGEQAAEGDASFYDYKAQKWMVRRGAMSHRALDRVDYKLDPWARVVTIDTPEEFEKLAARHPGLRSKTPAGRAQAMAEMRSDGIQAVVVRHADQGTDDPTDQFVRAAGGAQVIVLDPTAVSVVRPSKEAPSAKPATPAPEPAAPKPGRTKKPKASDEPLPAGSPLEPGRRYEQGLNTRAPDIAQSLADSGEAARAFRDELGAARAKVESLTAEHAALEAALPEFATWNDHKAVSDKALELENAKKNLKELESFTTYWQEALAPERKARLQDPEYARHIVTSFEADRMNGRLPPLEEWTPEMREGLDEAFRNQLRPYFPATAAKLPAEFFSGGPGGAPEVRLFALQGKEKEMDELALKMGRAKSLGSAPSNKVPALSIQKPIPKPATTAGDWVKAVRGAAAKDDSRYAISGVNVDRNGSRLTATDGRRLFMVTGEPGQFGKDGLYEGASISKEGKLGAKAEGSFPPSDDVIAGAIKYPIVTDRLDIESTITNLRKAAIMTSEESRGVLVVKNTDGTLGFAAATPAAGAAEINVHDGYEVLGAINPHFMVDALEFHAKEGLERVTLRVMAPNKPFTMHGPRANSGTLSVTMPVNVGDRGTHSEFGTKAAPPKPKAETAQAPKVKRGKNKGPETSAIRVDAATPEPEKRPWEMTRAEFRDAGFYQHSILRPDAAPIGPEGFKAGIGPNAWRATDGPPLDIMDARWATKKGRPVYVIPPDQIVQSANGPKVRPGFVPDAPLIPTRDFQPLHEMVLESALASGQTIPPEVLADYPHLAARQKARSGPHSIAEADDVGPGVSPTAPTPPTSAPPQASPAHKRLYAPAETRAGLKNVARIQSDPEGKRIGVRSISKTLDDALGVMRIARREQTTAKNPANYRESAHLIRSRAESAPWMFHESGHALSALLREADSDFLERLEDPLLDMALMPGSMASKESAEEGFADWVRRFVTNPESVIHSPLTDALLREIEAKVPKAMGPLYDAARAYRAHMQRPLKARWRSYMSDVQRVPFSLDRFLPRVLVDYVSRGFAADLAARSVYREVARHANGLRAGWKAVAELEARHRDTAADLRQSYQSLNHIGQMVGIALEGPGKVKPGEPTGLRVHATAGPGQTPELFTPEARLELEAAGFKLPKEPKKHGDMVVLAEKSVQDAASPVSTRDWPDFETYAQMKATLARAEVQNAERLAEAQKTGKVATPFRYQTQAEGVKLKDLREQIAADEKANPKWLGVFKDLEEINNATLLLDVMNGEISVKDAITLKNRYEHYLPLTRMGATGPRPIGDRATTRPTAGLHRSFGSANPSEPILLATARKLDQAVNAYYYNRFMLAPLHLAEDMANDPKIPHEARMAAGRVAIPLRLDTKKMATLSSEEQAKIIHAYIVEQVKKGDVRFNLTPDDLDGFTPDDIGIIDPKAIFRKVPPKAVNVVAPVVRGQRRYFQLNDPGLFGVFASDDRIGKIAQWSERIFGASTASQKKQITNTFTFALRSLARDPLTAMMFGKDPQALIPGFYHAVGALAMATGRGDANALVKPELMSRVFRNFSAEDFAARRSKLMDELIGGIVPRGWHNLSALEKGLSFPGIMYAIALRPFELKQVLTGQRALANFVESAPRVGAFVMAKRRGLSDEAAQLAADTVTGNFADRPLSANTLSVYRNAGFVNPAMQIFGQQLRFFTDPVPARGAASLAMRLGAIASATALAWAAREAFMTAEGEKTESEILDQERVTHARIGPFRVPFDYGVVGAMQAYIWSVLDEMAGRSGVSRAALMAKIAGEILFHTSLNPLELAPFALKSATEAKMNYSLYRQGPIVPKGLQYLQPSDQAYDSTPDLYKWVGRMANVSPIKAQYFFRNGLGVQIDRMAVLIDRAKKGLLLDELTTLPEVAQLFGEDPIGWNSKSVRSVDELADQYAKLKKDLEALGEADSAAKQETIEALEAQMDKIGPAVDAMREIDSIWREVRERAKQGGPAARQKIEDLKRRMVDVARRSLSDMNRQGGEKEGRR